MNRTLWLMPYLVISLWFIPHTGVAQAQQWVNIGPTPIDPPVAFLSNFQFGKGPVTGRVADVAIDPNDADHWLIGAAYGGIWETRDAGTTWNPRSDDQFTLAMGAIAFYPSDPSLVFAGTGEAARILGVVGDVLLRSTNGGMTWEPLSARFVGTSFSDVKVDPTSALNLVVSTTFGKPRGLGSTVTQTADGRLVETGIFTSNDGGFRWRRQLAGVATDLEVNPTDFQRQYAGLGDRRGASEMVFAHAENGVYRSINRGIDWERLDGPWLQKSGGVGRVELAIAPSNPDILYVLIHDAENGVGNDKQTLGVWRTDNAWHEQPTWAEIPIPSLGFLGNNGAFHLEIIVDPENADILYAGGLDLYRLDRDQPSGSQWRNIRNGKDGIHVDQHTMAWAGNRLVVGNDGGVYSTTDEGNTWLNHNRGLTITQFHNGCVHPTNGDIVIGGSQDNGTERRTASNIWQRIQGVDGDECAISSTNPDTDWAISFQNLNIYRTTDGNVTEFQTASSGINENPFRTNFATCPANDDVFIAGGIDILWKTVDFFSADPSTGPTWFDDNTPNIPPVKGIGPGIDAFAFTSDPSCDSYVFGANEGSSIFRTTNGGNDWLRIDDKTRDCCVVDLAFHPDNPDILYAALDKDPKHTAAVLKTTNAMTASPVWFDVSPPFRDASPLALLVDPFNPNTIYVGSYQGVWHSIDGGATWTHMGHESGMPNVPVFDLEANRVGDIFAFTHGRGAYKLSATIVGDLNGDNCVDRSDLSLILSGIRGTPPLMEIIDINGDGNVNIADARFLVNLFTKQRGAPCL